MKVKVKIRRFNPEKDRKPYWAEYSVEAEPTDRVLDLLVQIKGYQDGSLTFRRSCAHGVCGSDALVINGRNRLACKELVQDVGKHITVEPLRGLPVIKDLTVDMEPFFRKYRSILPFLINDEPAPYTERPFVSISWISHQSGGSS
jgi:succinate dehydrogenase / fumarate reductase iron-sulfur subunit